MAIFIPIVAGIGGYFAAGAAVSALALSGVAAVVTGVVVGAVVGAAIGAVGSLITGGDIGEGALTGAFAGALGGGFAGVGAWGGSTAGEGMTAQQSYGVLQSDAASTVGNSTVDAALNSGSSLGSSGTSLSGLSGGTGNLVGSGLQVAGSMMQAQGAAKNNEAQLEAAAQARQEQFDNQMKVIAENHKNAMEQINAQMDGTADNSIALANINNTAAMERQKDTQQYQTDTQNNSWEHDADVQQQYNQSVAGVDSTLYERPTFDFSKATAFESETDGGAA